MPQIEKDYIITGKMKHVFMNFPLSFHQNAQKASEAANCAGDQGKFWQLHDRLFANQKAIGKDDLAKHAAALGLDMSRFKECLDIGRHSDEIKREMAEGQKAGITGTPAFLLGFVQSDGKVKAVKKIVGAQPYNNFKSAIGEMLSAKKER
jgi:protein-disulfide isomerase